MGLSVSPAQVELLASHLEMVLSANTEFNLTRIERRDSVALHVLDSCAAASLMGLAPDGRFADIGSGAGYPGIPLCVLSGRHCDLIESVGKKAAFLERVVRDLRLDATVHGTRAEIVAVDRPEAFSAVTARAVSALPSLVELAAPLLKKGGLLLCMKAAPDTSEIERGRAAAAVCGMVEQEIVAVDVPDGQFRRLVVIYRRSGEIRTKLPRRPGVAQHKPLA